MVSSNAKPNAFDTSFDSFTSRFRDEQNSNWDYLSATLIEWRQKPLDFWGRAEPLLCSGSPSQAIRLLSEFIDELEYGDLNPIRRRLSLAILDDIQLGIETRIQVLSTHRQLKIQQGAKRISVSLDALCQTMDNKLKTQVKTRIRAGKRYNRLREGMLLALGNISSSVMERCCPNVYNQIQICCEQNLPDCIDELDELAVELKEAILEREIDFTALDDIILCHKSCLRTNKTNASQNAKSGFQNEASKVVPDAHPGQAAELENILQDLPANFLSDETIAYRPVTQDLYEDWVHHAQEFPVTNVPVQETYFGSTHETFADDPAAHWHRPVFSNTIQSNGHENPLSSADFQLTDDIAGTMGQRFAYPESMAVGDIMPNFRDDPAVLTGISGTDYINLGRGDMDYIIDDPSALLQ